MGTGSVAFAAKPTALLPLATLAKPANKANMSSKANKASLANAEAEHLALVAERVAAAPCWQG